MSSTSSSSSTAIIPYIRTPYFISEFSSSSSSSSLSSFDCPYNPYYVLGLPIENIHDLFNLVNARTKDNEILINQRKQKIQEAYKELASYYHPDKYYFHQHHVIKKHQQKQNTINNITKESILFNNDNHILANENNNTNTTSKLNRRRPRSEDILTPKTNNTIINEKSVTNGSSFVKFDQENHNSNIFSSYYGPVYKNELYSWIPIEERFAAINNAANILRDISLTLQYFSLKFSSTSETSTSTSSSSTIVPNNDDFYQILNIIQMQNALQYRKSIDIIIEKLRYNMIFNYNSNSLLILLGLYGNIESLSIDWIDPTLSYSTIPYYWYKRKEALPPSVSNINIIPNTTIETYLPTSVIDITSILQAQIELNSIPHKEISTQLLTPNGKISTSNNSSLSSIAPNIQLVLPYGTKSKLEGFYDPCHNNQKFLLIRYIFLGKLHQIIYEDDQNIKLPLKKHMVTKDYMNNLQSNTYLPKTLINNITSYTAYQNGSTIVNKVSTNTKEAITVPIEKLQNYALNYYQEQEKLNSSLVSSSSSPLSRRILSKNIVESSSPAKEKQGKSTASSLSPIPKEKSIPLTNMKTNKKPRIIRSPLTAARNNKHLQTINKVYPTNNTIAIPSSNSSSDVRKIITFDTIITNNNNYTKKSSALSSYFTLSNILWGSTILTASTLTYIYYTNFGSDTKRIILPHRLSLLLSTILTKYNNNLYIQSLVKMIKEWSIPISIKITSLLPLFTSSSSITNEPIPKTE